MPPLPQDPAELADAYRLPAGRHLRVNFVASLDGAISVDGRSGGLGSDGDLRVFRTLRALADAVLVGAGTAAAEGYRPVLPDSAVGRLRAQLGRPAVAPVVVVSRRASLRPDDQLATAAVTPTLLVTCAAADADRRAALTGAGVVLLVCGDDDVDLPTALDALAERGHEQVLCEGGPALFTAALAAGVVDELDLSIAPLLVGGGPGLLPSALPAPPRAELVQALTEDGVLFTRYSLR
ncbi:MULTISPECIES: dihydrofolate reductase family protein [unclassified Modestobacter]|uniref:dihydrofolate reductase family protein n=1 Tax=unclassified Modestobacter TaxID=2643866 RepID=UPI0022AB2AFF|nr:MULTISPECIES: dihydrofolate reductase family protein [unclassified Modestobacter]MCZ2827026.1 dihydrofolate reductase family protein [Modestobacter sp. VKM Ac-2981]MCZ2855278.1 dihydrofolate reductase family protein [Modestobacter sp. VKM Ac-2982]